MKSVKSIQHNFVIYWEKCLNSKIMKDIQLNKCTQKLGKFLTKQ